MHTLVAPVTDPIPNAIIKGAVSPETAAVVTDYPWGFRLRCEMRYWLERNKKGTRMVSQTVDPRNGRVNKPKASTYTDGLTVLVTTEEGHIERRDITIHACHEWASDVSRYNLEKLDDFVRQYSEGFTEEQHIQARAMRIVMEAFNIRKQKQAEVAI